MLARLSAALRGRRYGLRSKAIGEMAYNADLQGGAAPLYHSAFNLDWFAELGIAPRTIMDLGSYDGGDAYRFKHTFPDARVVTVEADPDRHALVADNLKGQDIELLNVAANNRDGDIDWFPATLGGETDAQGSIFQHTDVYRDKFPMVEQAKDPSKVTGRRFDTMTRELGIDAVDLLHMDIEGAEHTVLMTLGDIRPRLIYLEWREGMFNGEACGPATEALLARHGYKLILRKSADRLYFLPA